MRLGGYLINMIWGVLGVFLWFLNILLYVGNVLKVVYSNFL